MSNVLVIAAHPDDELLGCGGVAIKHAQAGDLVYALILGEGVASRDEYANDAFSELRQEAKRAGDIIGFKEVFFSDFPDNRFDSVALLDIAKEVEKYVADIKPEVVYTHHGYDVNIDHQKIYHAVITACRPCNDNCPKELYTFETLSSTEWQHKDHKQFSPNVYVDIKDVLEQKVKAMEAYASEIRDFPHSRSSEGIRVLAKFRGIEAGMYAAEALCLVRKLT
ncbi:MAG: GlcNAc-PI de-N-acetylase [Candidatus Magasanikbacteria bacterium]|nr:GlcNAc-PI de-N-acetylase [Candidatus Magasanikbacteria bacterium]